MLIHAQVGLPRLLLPVVQSEHRFLTSFPVRKSCILKDLGPGYLVVL